MANFVILDTSEFLGGAETFNARFIKYLGRDKCNKVILLTVPDGVVKRLLLDAHVEIDVFYIPEAWTFNVSPRSRQLLKKLGSDLRSILTGKIFVLCCYIENLHKAMYMFDGQNDISMLSGVLHPEAWSLWRPETGFDAKRSFGPRHVDELWHYKRELLKELDNNKALWYPNDIYRRYNEYYFELKLTHVASATVPVELPHLAFKYQPTKSDNLLRIVWLGRFDFFKNASIRAFVKNLSQVRTNKSIDFVIDLIGYGEFQYEQELRKLGALEGIQINFIGKLSESDIHLRLCQEQYHFGFGMGSSAYHLAAFGLPVLAIDSAVNGYEQWVQACWLCDASDEFDEGSSLYLDLIGEAAANRQRLSDIILNLVSNVDSLETIGQRCQTYVRKYHDVDDIMARIVSFMMNSTFNKKIVFEPEKVIPTAFFFQAGECSENIDIAIFGTGSASRAWCDLVESHNERNTRKINISYFFDNDLEKHGKIFYERIVNPVVIDLCNAVDVVVLASEYWFQMQKQLVELGVERRKIFRAL